MPIYIFFNLEIELSKNKSINYSSIKLVEDKYLFSRPIYSLSLIEQEIVKIVIKIYLKTRFIKSAKSPQILTYHLIRSLMQTFLYVSIIKVSIISLSKIIIFALIGRSLEQLGQAKQFTQLNPTNIYYSIRIQKDDK